MTTQTNETPLAAGADDSDDRAGDLSQLYELATLVTSAKDAMSDEIVTRMSSAFSEGISLLDRVTRNEGLMRLLRALDRPETQLLLSSLADAISTMSRELATAPPAKGGIVGMVQLAREPGTAEGLRMLSLLSRHLTENLRERNRRDGTDRLK